MKTRFRSIVMLAMAAVMLLALFAGCTSPSPSDSAGSDTSPSPVNSTEPTPSSDDGGNDEPSGEAGIPGWVPFEKNVHITVPVYDRSKEGYPNVDDNYWTDWIQEQFGDKYNITVEYVAIPRGDVMNAYSLLIVGQQTPTIMMEYDYPKVAEWASQGSMAELDLDAFKQVAPTYYQAMVDNNQLQYTDINGKTHFVLSERPYYNTTFTFATLVRKDWQDALGKGNPTSYAEYVELIDAIIASDLTNVPPVGLALPSDAYARNFAFRDYPVDEAEWAMHSSLGTGSLTWEPTKQLFKRQNTEFNKGYFSKEYDLDVDVSGGSSQWRTNFVNGKVYNFQGYMSANVDWLSAFYDNNPEAELTIQSNYQPVEPGVVDVPQIRADNPFGMIIGFSSLATEDELKAAWMLMEWMIQEENLFVLENGIEGVTFTYDDDGLPVVDGDYRGDGMLNHNMNIDMTCLVHASKKIGTIEETIKSITPKGIKQDFTQDLINNYYELKQIADNGWAYSDPVFAVTFNSEAEFTPTLLSLWKEYGVQLTKCKPEEFEALYADLSQKYLDAGYQAIIDERLAAYNAGNSTKLPKN